MSRAPDADGWVSLSDVQWMNIVNHDHAYADYSKDEAVHAAVKATEAKLREINAAAPAAVVQAEPSEWQPIATVPQDGYFLIFEDEAIRAMLRIDGVWHQPSYPAIITHPWGDVIVGDDARRLLPTGYRLEIRDGCCQTPTHWMPLPAAPKVSP